MTESQRKMMEQMNLSESDFEKTAVSDKERIAELEEMLAALLEGRTE